MPYQLEEIPPPTGMIKCNTVQYWTFLILNIFVAVFFAAVEYLDYGQNAGDYIDLLQLASTWMVFLLQLTSGLYLGYSIYKTRKLVRKHN